MQNCCYFWALNAIAGAASVTRHWTLELPLEPLLLLSLERCTHYMTASTAVMAALITTASEATLPGYDPCTTQLG